MLPSMFSGISGLKANQKKLDVIGNNISNASTTSFKSQRVRFQDMISQTMAFASGPNATIGGTNPKQVGLGVQIAGIDTNMATGNMQPTSRNLDCAIDGPGYFVVGRGELKDTSDADNITVDATAHTVGETNGFDMMYSRDGSFTLDTKGDLITSDGLRVFGYPNTNAPITYKKDPADKDLQHEIATPTSDVPDIKKDQLAPLVIPDKIGEDRVQSFTIEKDGCLTATLATGKTVTIGQLAMASFKNEAGLTKMGKNLYQTSPNSGAPVMRSAKGDTDADNSKGYGDMLQGMLEMSNVDLAEQFTEMIIASRAFQANGKMISTGDEILQDLVNLKR